MTHNPCHARRAMASKARPWLGKGTHSVTEQFLRRMDSLALAMLSFASHCEAGNDSVLLYQPAMIPGARVRRSSIGYASRRCLNRSSIASAHALPVAPCRGADLSHLSA